MADLYAPNSPAEIRDQFLRDIRLAAIDSGVTDPPVEPGTDWYYLATAVSEISAMGFANQAAAEDDTNVLTATGDALDHIREGLGLPEVGATKASGKIVVEVSGVVTIPAGQEFVYPSGVRGRVLAQHINPSTDDEIDVEAVTAGAAGNLRADQVVRFVAPPVNLVSEAKVSRGEPISNGTDAESDDRKRDRILNKLRNKPSGYGDSSSWGRIRQFVLDTLGVVQDCYVYPALGGPGSCKIVPVKDLDPENGDFSRALSSTAMDTVVAEIQAQLGIPQENVVQTVANENCDYSLLLELPNSVADGGTGIGWVDVDPWPVLHSSDSNIVTITAVNTTNDQLTLSAYTSTAPIAGVAHIAWWSSVDRKFYTAMITSVSGSSNAWIVGLDRPLVGKGGLGPAIGDYVSPAAHNMDRYGDAWITMFRGLGPGENTTDVNRLPRAKRHPYTTLEDPCAITNATLMAFTKQFDEITDFSKGRTSPSTPTVPASVATAPNILVPRRFAIYEIS